MSHYQSNQYPTGYVSPQSLMNMPPPASSSTSQRRSSNSTSSGRHRRPQDVGSLQAGAKHQLSHDPLPTAQSMLDGSYLALVAKNNEERDIVLYVPRLPEHCGPASLPSVVFSVAGTPGPYLKELIRGKVTLDGAHDTIFEEHGWRRASLIVDWPGVTSSVEYHPCADKNHHFTRTEIAQIVANSIADIITTGKTGKSLKWGPQVIDRQTQPWDLRNIDYRDVRLIAINYYRKAWVPVLAIDA